MAIIVSMQIRERLKCFDSFFSSITIFTVILIIMFGVWRILILESMNQCTENVFVFLLNSVDLSATRHHNTQDTPTKMFDSASKLVWNFCTCCHFIVKSLMICYTLWNSDKSFNKSTIKKHFFNLIDLSDLQNGKFFSNWKPIVWSKCFLMVFLL